VGIQAFVFGYFLYSIYFNAALAFSSACIKRISFGLSTCPLHNLADHFTLRVHCNRQWYRCLLLWVFFDHLNQHNQVYCHYWLDHTFVGTTDSAFSLIAYK